MGRGVRNAIVVSALGATLGGVIALIGVEHRVAEPKVVPILAGVGILVGLAAGASRAGAALMALVGLCLFGMASAVTSTPALGAAQLIFVTPTFLGLASWVLWRPGRPTVRLPSILSAAAERANIADAIVVLLCLAAIGAFAGERSIVAPVFLVLSAALVVVGFLDARALGTVARWATFSLPTAEGTGDRTRVVDLGVGAGVRVLRQDANHPYRGREGIRFVGDPDATRRQLRRRVAADAAFASLGILGCVAGVVFPSAHRNGEHPATPDPPLGWLTSRPLLVIDVDADGVEDVVGVHRAAPESAEETEAYALVAVSGATFRRLWSTTSRARAPKDFIFVEGHVYELYEDEVRVSQVPSGEQLATVGVNGGSSLCATSEGAFVHQGASEFGPRVSPTGRVTELARPGHCEFVRRYCDDHASRPCEPWFSAVALQDAGFGSSPILRRHLGDGAGTSSSEPGKLFEPALLKPHVFGFDAITLQVRWAVPTGGRAALEVAYGRVITHVTSAYPPDHVEARDAKSGALLWQTAVFTAPEDRFVRGGRVHASPTRIYLLASERIVVIDARTGERLATLR